MCFFLIFVKETNDRLIALIVSTDDFAGWLALQTNLALKGIIGINAMSELAKFVGKDHDFSHYKVFLSLCLSTRVVMLTDQRIFPIPTSLNGKSLGFQETLHTLK